MAEDVTIWVHDVDATKRVKTASRALFGGGSPEPLDACTLADAVAKLPRAEGSVGMPLIGLFIVAGFEKGLGAARRTVASGGLYLNNVKTDDGAKALGLSDLLLGGVVLLRRGKKNLAVVGVA